jgi:hypothetical protein
MRSSLAGRLAASLVLGGVIALLQSGCASEPTSTETSSAPQFATTSGPVLQVGGPDSISATGNYTYSAYWPAAYANVLWYGRTCSTNSITSCTAPWVQKYDVSFDGLDHWYHTERLTLSCPVKPPYFQNKVVASAFGQQPQTAYKVTKLCSASPN